MNPETVSIVRRCHSEMTDEYKQYEYARAKEDAGLELYKILEQYKTPCVVEIEDGVRKRPNFSNEWVETFPVDEIWVKIRITPVEHRHVTVAHQYPPLLVWKRLTILDRIRGWFK